MTAIEVFDGGAIAATVDGEGHVTARAEVRGAADGPTAASEALRQLPGPDEPVIVATVFDQPAAEAACAALVSRGIPIVGQPIASGVAAAAAEAWVGAAQGAEHIV